jgi:uncharacterized membrane protein YedE/YeeE
MEKLIDGVVKGLLEFNRNAFFRSLAYGLVFSTLMTLIIGGIEDVFAFSNSFPYILVHKQAYWIGVLFASLVTAHPFSAQ